MKTKKVFLVLACLLGAAAARAQSTINVSASHIQGLNGTLMTSGSICFQATDQNDRNIGTEVSGGGVVITTPFCTAVTGGAIATFNVPNPSTSSPTNVRYRITILQGSRVVATFPNSYLCLASGACTSPWTFNFDTCISTGACTSVPMPLIAGPGGPPGATGATGPAGPINQVANNGSGLPVEPTVNLTGSASCADSPGTTSTICSFTGAPLTADNSWTNNNRFKGPIPHVDVSAYARPNPITGNVGPSTTATCAGGNSCTFASVSNFQIGDGVTIRAAGANLTMTTPPSKSGFTVTPSLSAGGMGLGGGNYSSITTVASGTGSSTYNYKIIGRDQAGGFTAPSSAVTITNGLASLGAVTCAVSSASRSGMNVTVNFSSSCAGAVAGAAMKFFGSTSSSFDGYYNIQTVNSSTQVVYSGPYDSNGFGWQAGDSTINASTGGTATFVLSNHLRWTFGTGVWQYYVCAERPGDSSYALIGITKPNTTLGQDVQFDDYGSPGNDNQIYPSYITNTLCNSGSAQNDPLTTTITNIGGTTVTLANAVTNTVSGATAVFDDAPGILAAMQSVQTANSGNVLIPWTAFQHPFVINSYFNVPLNVSVRQVGQVSANETIEFQGATNVWDGSLSSNELVQFGFNSSGSAVLNTTAVPGIYQAVDGARIQNLMIQNPGNVNGGLLELDEAFHVTRKNIQYVVSSGTADYLGAAIWYRGTGASQDSEFNLGKSAFSTGNTSGVDWAPEFFVPANQTGTGMLSLGQVARILVDDTDMGPHGFMQVTGTGGAYWRFQNIIRQGGLAPLLWLEGTGRDAEQVALYNVTLDTDSQGAVVIGNVTGVAALAQLDIDAQNLQNGNSDTGGVIPPFTGFAPRYVTQRFNATGRMPNSSGDGTCPSTTSTTGSWNYCLYTPLTLPGENAEVYFPLSAPVAPVATPQTGGSLAAGTYQFQIAAADITGKQTVASPLSTAQVTSGTCPASGNCEFSIAYTAIPGAATYSLYGCLAVGTGFLSTCPQTNNVTTGTAFTTNPLLLTTLGGGTFPPNNMSQAGSSGMTANVIWGPSAALTPRIFSSLSACSAALVGTAATVTDSTTTTWGATITGSGANTVVAYCDGTNWTVAAK